MIVTLSPNEEAELVTHGGQEFNYVLEGSIKVVIEGREFILNKGDSIYFNPALPHGQRAVGGQAKVFDHNQRIGRGQTDVKQVFGSD